MTAAPTAAKKLPPLWVTWTIITAVGSAIFGALTTLVNGEPQGLFMSVLVGGLIVGGLEWRSLRHYRVPVSPLWCAAKAIMMLILFGVVMAGMAFAVEGWTYLLLPVCGCLLDGARGWLLRSHLPYTKRWVIGCAIGWFIELGLLAGAGIITLGLFDAGANHTLFFALNGAINGAWMGFCRGVVLTGMLSDRHQHREPSPSVEF